MVLTLLLACKHDDPVREPGATADPEVETTTVSLLEDTGETNLLLPSDVELGLDDTLWVLGARGRIASVDLTVPEVRWIRFVDFGFSATEGLLVTQDGQLWVPELNGRRVARIDPESLEVDTITLPFAELLSITAWEEGGVIVTGSTDGTNRIVLLDADGEEATTLDVGGVLGDPLEVDGALQVTRQDGDGQAWITTWSLPDLVEGESVEAPFFGELNRLDDGTLILLQHEMVATLDPVAGTWTQLALGVDNSTVLSLGETALVVDLGANLNHSQAYEIDAALNIVADFPTGMHTGDAVLDPLSGSYWMNAEDETAVLSFDRAGKPLQALQLGRHVESLIADPDGSGRLHYTGRLTAEFGTVDMDSGEVTSSAGLLTWPVALARSEDTLWVLDHVDGAIAALDPDTLEARDILALDLRNEYRVFDDLGWCDVTGTLLVTYAPTGELLEVDPADGTILTRWTVTRRPPNTGVSGRVEVLVDGDQVWTLDTSTGELSRIELGSDAVAASGLADGDSEGALHALFLDGDTLYAAGKAFDATKLEERPEDDVAADVVVGRAGDIRLGLNTTDDLLVAFDPSGTHIGTWPLPGLERPPDAVWDAETRTLVCPVTPDAWVYRMELGAWIDSL